MFFSWLFVPASYVVQRGLLNLSITSSTKYNLYCTNTIIGLMINIINYLHYLTRFLLFSIITCRNVKYRFNFKCLCNTKKAYPIDLFVIFFIPHIVKDIQRNLWMTPTIFLSKLSNIVYLLLYTWLNEWIM